MISFRSSAPQERQWLDRRTEGGKSMLNLLLAQLEGVAAGMERFIPGYAFGDRFTGRHPGLPSQNADGFTGIELQELAFFHCAIGSDDGPAKALGPDRGNPVADLRDRRA